MRIGFYVGGAEPAAGGPPQPRYFLLRKDQYTVQDTWDTIGMRGTGSNTVVVDDLFVRDEFTLSTPTPVREPARERTTNADPALHPSVGGNRRPGIYRDDGRFSARSIRRRRHLTGLEKGPQRRASS